MNTNPLRLVDWNRLPVRTLPDPVVLPEGTVKPASRLFSPVMDERLAQPVPVQVAAEVENPVPVSVVPFVAKVPPDKLMVI